MTGTAVRKGDVSAPAAAPSPPAGGALEEEGTPPPADGVAAVATTAGRARRQRGAGRPPQRLAVKGSDGRKAGRAAVEGETG